MKKLLLILLCVPLIGLGQDKLLPQNTLGIVSNLSNAPIGMNFFVFQNEKLGVYMDCKFGIGELPSGQDYSSTMSYNEFNDPFIGYYNSGYTLIDLGVAKPLISSDKSIIIGFVGLGYFMQTKYAQYYDAMHILSSSGYYYYETDIEYGVNLNLGLQLQTTSKINFQIGYDINPKGLNIGVGYIL